MAMYMRRLRNGIQKGDSYDYCKVCTGTHENPEEVDNLNNQDVFKIYINGQIYVYCIDHFKEMLDGYELTKIEQEYE